MFDLPRDPEYFKIFMRRLYESAMHCDENDPTDVCGCGDHES